MLLIGLLIGAYTFANASKFRSFVDNSSFKNRTGVLHRVVDNRNATNILRNFGLLKSLNEIIGYWWMLGSDGCWYLGRVTINERGELWFEQLDALSWAGRTVRCMTNEEFEVLC